MWSAIRGVHVEDPTIRLHPKFGVPPLDERAPRRMRLVQVLEVHVAFAPSTQDDGNEPPAARVENERTSCLAGHRLSNDGVVLGVIAELVQAPLRDGEALRTDGRVR